MILHDDGQYCIVNLKYFAFGPVELIVCVYWYSIHVHLPLSAVNKQTNASRCSHTCSVHRTSCYSLNALES